MKIIDEFIERYTNKLNNENGSLETKSELRFAIEVLERLKINIESAEDKKRNTRMPQPFKVIRLSGQPFWIDPIAWKLADAKRLHDWSGRLVLALEKYKRARAK